MKKCAKSWESVLKVENVWQSVLKAEKVFRNLRKCACANCIFKCLVICKDNWTNTSRGGGRGGVCEKSVLGNHLTV